MSKRPVVPQFGKWDIEDSIPYTAYFDTARQGKFGGKMINPNDPLENPDSPQHNDNVGCRVGSTPQDCRSRGPGSGRPASAGSEYCIQKSPLHPQHQAKPVRRYSGSSSREPEHLYNSNRVVTPGRTGPKPVSRDASIEKSAVVPRFGEWENDPSSSSNYSVIFNQVREEKAAGSPMPSNISVEPSANANTRQNDRKKYKSQSGCFPWCGM